MRGELDEGEARERRIETVIGEVVDARARGERIDVPRILEAHPDLASELAPRLALVTMLGAMREGLALDVAPSDAAPVEAGTRVGPYRVVARLGSGGMGIVYLAEDERGHRVAVKLIHPRLLRERSMVERFRREIEAGSRLRHPGVVATLGSGTAKLGGEERLYLVMEYVEGRTLRGRLEEMVRVPEGYAREIARQLAEALAAIHRARLVHRDLKPENVMLTDDDRVRIMDLGMARLVDAVITLTRDGQFTGSLLYASPEQLRGGEVSERTDLYGLGLLLFELVTGERPFTPGEAMRMVDAAAPAGPPAASARGADVTPFFEALLATLLAPDPRDRFASADEVRRVLEEGRASAWWSAWLARQGPGLPPPPLRADRGIPLVGRDVPRNRLQEAWQAARGGRGGVVVLEGGPGAGKTRLVAELLAAAAPAPRLYADLAGGSHPDAFGQAVARQFGTRDLERRLADYLEHADDARAIARHASGERADAADGESGPSLDRALASLLAGVARRHPTLWVLDGLDDADAGTVRAAWAIARASRDRAALVVLVGAHRRPEAPLDDPLPPATRIVLDRLDAAAMREMLSACLAPADGETPFDADLLARAEGVPGFLVALLRGLEQDGALARKGNGRYRVRAPGVRLRLPADLLRLAEASLSRLRSPTDAGRIDERDLLALAAADGIGFDAGLLAEAMGCASMAVLQALAEIERRTGIVESRGRAYRFESRLLRDVLHPHCPSADCAALHDRLAAAYEARARGGDGPAAREAFVRWVRHGLLGRTPTRVRDVVGDAVARLEAEGRQREARALETLAANRFAEGPGGPVQRRGPPGAS